MAIISLVFVAVTVALPPSLHYVLIRYGLAEMWTCAVILYMVRGIAQTSAFCATTIMLQQVTHAHLGAVNGVFERVS